MMDEKKIREAVRRGWGNAYIAWENSKIGVFVINDWDRMAASIGLTDEEKEKAIAYMEGDVFDHSATQYALRKFKEYHSSSRKAN